MSQRRFSGGTRRPGPALLAVIVLGPALGLSGQPARAVETRVISVTPSSLSRGEANGVAITLRGRLFLGPRLSRLADGAGRAGGPRRAEPAHVWAAASDGDGNVYLGTGPEGQILQLASGGKRRVLYSVPEPMVTALALLPGGDLIAGTAPEGKVYRVRRGGGGELWSETGERYVWSLAVSSRDRVYAGTGEDGRVYEIDRSGHATLFFDSDEAHIMSLTTHPESGDLLAGGAGRGLVYQLDEEGHALVLHDDDLPEVVDLAVEPDGSVVAALLAPARAEPRRPAIRIRLPAGAVAGVPADNVELEEQPGPTVEGSIEGLPVSPRAPKRELRGRVVRIAPQGVVNELWSSSDEAPYSVGIGADRRVLFGTGEPARIYRADPGGDVALLATLREAQVTSLLRSGGTMVAATSNAAAAYRLERLAPETGVFLSRPIDAGAPAHWGSIRWRAEGDPGRAEVYTRTGNSAVPDATWSAWSPALTVPGGSPIVNPDGRFLQWRARLLGRDAAASTISSFSVTFTSYNRSPALRDFRLDAPAAAVSREATFRWSTADPDGDPVTVEVQYRAPGAGSWSTAVQAGPVEPIAGDRAGWSAGRVVWDTSAIDEGNYEVRALASDQNANHPGEGRSRVDDPGLELAVDRTVPRIEAQRAPDGSVEVVVADELSGVRRLEFLQNGRKRFSPRPVDGVCDSPREKFVLSAGQVEGDGWSLRAVDAAGNAAEQPLDPS